MPADFSHLSKLQTVKTARYTMYQVAGEPVLIVAPATQSNKAYFNAQLQRSRKSMRRLRQGSLNADMLRDMREDDRELYPRHIIKGWEGIKDAQDKDAEFNDENVQAFLAALPDWVFDDLRNFCGETSNFLDQDQMDEEAVEETAKN